jgi:hypothetical protein
MKAGMKDNITDIIRTYEERMIAHLLVLLAVLAIIASASRVAMEQKEGYVFVQSHSQRDCLSKRRGSPRLPLAS